MSVSLGYVIFYVPDVAKSIAFYTEAFGLSAKFITPENDYGELDTGATTLSFVSHELAQTNLDEAGGFTALDAAPAPAGATITLVADDVDAMVASAVAAGASVYVATTQKPWGQTVAYITDPSGILVELATPVAS